VEREVSEVSGGEEEEREVSEVSGGEEEEQQQQRQVRE
jgi:hypothetical protein